MTRSNKALGLALSLIACLTVATGSYFMVFRPALLPEDLRFMGVHETEVPDGVRRWISIVFRTWGAFAVGLGLCIIGSALSLLLRSGSWWRLGMAAGLAFAFGSFFLSNVQLHSDFLWFVSLTLAVALCCAVLLVVSRRSDP